MKKLRILILLLPLLTGCKTFVSEHRIDINHNITIRLEKEAGDLADALVNTPIRVKTNEKNTEDK